MNKAKGDAVREDSDGDTTVAHARDVYTEDQMAQFRMSGLWRDAVLTDFLAEHAAVRPDEIAIVDEERSITWAELSRHVDHFASGLLSRGLVKGDFVAIQLPNCIEFVIAFLAIQRAGLRALTMLTIYREHDIMFMTGTCAARLVVVPSVHRGFDFAAMYRLIRAELPTVETVVTVGGESSLEGEVSFAQMLETDLRSTEDLDRLRPDPDSISKVSFTSGTTGFPKGVVHTHNTDLVPPLFVQQAFGVDASTPIWMPSPIGHVTGLLFGVHSALLNGAKLVLQDAWDPEVALQLIERERPHMTVSATPFISSMLEVPVFERYDVSSLKYFVSGGARIPPALVARAREAGIELLRVFGSAEAPLHTANLPDAAWDKKIARDGRPFPGVESRIVDPDRRDVELAAGEIGEYSTRGPHVFLGYYRASDLTAEVRDDDGWYYSGDLCEIDEEGYVLYVDRIKDIVNRGGIKISALEVENELVTHPSILQAAVVAVPDERLGEKGCAFVVLRSGASLTLEDVRSHMESLRITRQKWPEDLRIVDVLPTTATGKVRKVELREQYESGLV